MSAKGNGVVTAPAAGDRSDLFQSWFALAELEQAFRDPQPSLALCRSFVADAQRVLLERFHAGADIEDLIHGRSWLVDQVLVRCWEHLLGDSAAALIAVGGYGRRELLPGSDVDIMVLLGAPENPQLSAQIERLLMLLWDIGLEVGHSVRTLDDCSEQAQADITVATNLMEARLLCGVPALFVDMRARTGPAQIWPEREFFEAKLEEQKQRYRRFHDALYNLEPNVKESPGGLRDAQMIAWVFKRHFGSDSLSALIGRGLITQSEYRTLMEGQWFLWKVRFGLHTIAKRREDRLLFDHQRTLAKLLGYQDRDHRLAVEWFMKDYYRAIQELSRLNEMLLQLLREPKSS